MDRCLGTSTWWFPLNEKFLMARVPYFGKLSLCLRGFSWKNLSWVPGITGPQVYAGAVGFLS